MTNKKNDMHGSVNTNAIGIDEQTMNLTLKLKLWEM